MFPKKIKGRARKFVGSNNNQIKEAEGVRTFWFFSSHFLLFFLASQETQKIEMERDAENQPQGEKKFVKSQRGKRKEEESQSMWRIVL